MDRGQQIIRTSVVGIVTNVSLAAFKALVGALSSSIAIVLDAVNNLTDVLSSIITIAGVKLSQRPANRKHPFGYGRVEYFSAILIALIVLTVGIYAVATGDNQRKGLQTQVMNALANHPELVQVHGFYYSEKENLVTVDVVPDLSVKDDLALCQTLTQELNALLPGKTVLIAVDHNYSE